MAVALPGYRKNPLKLLSPQDLQRAGRHIARPSSNQARAGNYRKAHINVCGLDVTIETPKDDLRRGVGPDGTPWSVRMPVDYGYVKRTIGADGDQVDVYLGPAAHRASDLPVWVIDQCDADSKCWDEHKCMLGFPDNKTARETYLNAFSDGKGHHRIGSVMRMSFATFCAWLKSGRTREPINYKAAALSASSRQTFVTYGSDIDSAVTAHGGSMTTTPVSPDNSTDPRAMGAVTKMLSRVMGRMTPDDRTAMLQDAAALSSTELGKAEELTKAEDMVMPANAHTGYIEDHWSTTADDRTPVTSAHGPGSSVPSGSLNVGPSQQASGNGAMPMERQYSRIAPQVGSTESATQLGRDFTAMRGAMKSLVAAMHGINTQIEVLKANAAQPTTAITDVVAKAVKDAVEAAVAKAMAPIKAGIVAAKAGNDSWENADEEAKAAALLAKADDAGKKKDRDTEDDDDSETAKSASELRVMAKSYVDYARLRISKALDFAAENKAKAAQRAMTLAEADIAKANELVTEAQALRDGKAGLSTQLLKQDIAKAQKGITASIANNQDIWPASTDAPVGKGDTAPAPAAAAAQPAHSPDLAKAMEQIQAAASGMGMLQASVSDMMNALVAKNTATIEGERTNLPPVFALAKAGASDLNSREMELSQLRDNNVISFDDFDRARDTLMRVRMNMPADTIQAMVDRLPEAAKAVLTRGAA